MARSRGLGETQFQEKLAGTPLPIDFVNAAVSTSNAAPLPENGMILFDVRDADVFITFGSSVEVTATENNGVLVAAGESLLVSLADGYRYFAAAPADGSSTFKVVYFEMV
jgi:hypothetical protein